MANNSNKWFILTTKFNKSTNDAALLAPYNINTEGKADIQLEGTATKRQENTTTKKIVMQKIHAYEIHVKLGHTG